MGARGWPYDVDNPFLYPQQPDGRELIESGPIRLFPVLFQDEPEPGTDEDKLFHHSRSRRTRVSLESDAGNGYQGLTLSPFGEAEVFDLPREARAQGYIVYSQTVSREWLGEGAKAVDGGGGIKKQKEQADSTCRNDKEGKKDKKDIALTR